MVIVDQAGVADLDRQQQNGSCIDLLDVLQRILIADLDIIDLCVRFLLDARPDGVDKGGGAGFTLAHHALCKLHGPGEGQSLLTLLRR